MPPPKDPIKYEEWRRKNSEGIKKKWKDPEYRRKQLEFIAKRKNDPEFQRRYRVGIDRRTDNPIWRANNKKAMQDREKNPEWRDRHNKILKGVCLANLTKDPNFYSNIAKGKFVGEKSPLWKGGISFEPYCPKFNKEFKERVRAFFGYQCVNCGSLQNGKLLHVHHVNFNKKTCCDNSIPLFVSLCQSCHAKTQKNRPYWEHHFTEIIDDYYGGKCYLTKEEYESFIM